MAKPMIVLLVLIGAGAALGAARQQLARLEPARFARIVLIAVTATMSVRVIAYFLANVFALAAAKPWSTGPYDSTNVIIGALYSLVLLTDLGREPDVRAAMRIATGGAFVLAGLGNAFHLNGPDYFVAVGYTRTFHLFIMTAEVTGGAALLLPWNWLTLMVTAGLTVDMFGALYTQMRVGEPLDPAAIAMLFRLTLLAMLCLHARSRTYRPATLAAGAVVCALIAIGGARIFLLDH